MLIKVTQERIEKGKIKTACSCAVALAIAAEINLPVMLDQNYIYTPKNRYETPTAVAIFIDRLDAGLPVQPFEFELEDLEQELV